MRKSYRRSVKTESYPQMTLNEFEFYVSTLIEEMINADRCPPIVDSYGTKTFAAAGFRDQGFGIFVNGKDGTRFVLSIKSMGDPE